MEEDMLSIYPVTLCLDCFEAELKDHTEEEIREKYLSAYREKTNDQ